MSGAQRGATAPGFTAAAVFPVVVLTLIWGCNWPVLKMGVAELPPLTFRSVTLPFAAMGMLAVARFSGDSIRVPRRLWGKIAVLAFFNIALWNACVLFGLQHLPAGRTAILAYTMPVWGVLFAFVLLDEPLSKFRLAGLVLGMIGMGVLLGDDIRHLQRAPTSALLILLAAVGWALGTVLLRKWQLPLPQNTMSGWMMLAGWLPLAILAPFFSPGPLPELSARAWFAILYNIFLAGTVAHGAWYTLARTLPVAVSSMASLPVPIAGVFAGMILLGERPGTSEWVALALVVAAMLAVLAPARSGPAPMAPDD